MRLNFWEDSLKSALKEVFFLKQDKNQSEPITFILKEAFSKTPIKQETLFRIIDFQTFDMERGSEMNTMEDLEIYAENTRSLLLYLNLNMMNVKDRNAFIAASHIGRGVGMVDVLKKLPGLFRLNVNMLPQSIIDKNGGHSFSLWDRHGTVSEEFYDCILEYMKLNQNSSIC